RALDHRRYRGRPRRHGRHAAGGPTPALADGDTDPMDRCRRAVCRDGGHLLRLLSGAESGHAQPDRSPAFRVARNRCGAAWVAKGMSVKVYGINHVAIEVDDVARAVAFYQDVFGLEKLDQGEGDAFFKVGEHQFLAMFRGDGRSSGRARHFGLIVRDDKQLAEVRDKLTSKY